MREHLFTNKVSHSFEHLKSSSSCRDVFGEGCFKLLDLASTNHSLKIKESLHIMWERPNLNKQLQHYNVSLSFWRSFFIRCFRSFFPLIHSIDGVRLLQILMSLYSTDDGLMSRPKHVLQIEQYCRVSSTTI